MFTKICPNWRCGTADLPFCITRHLGQNGHLYLCAFCSTLYSELFIDDGGVEKVVVTTYSLATKEIFHVQTGLAE